jgi:hypothetical protein
VRSSTRTQTHTNTHRYRQVQKRVRAQTRVRALTPLKATNTHERDSSFPPALGTTHMLLLPY